MKERITFTVNAVIKYKDRADRDHVIWTLSRAFDEIGVFSSDYSGAVIGRARVTKAVAVAKRRKRA